MRIRHALCHPQVLEFAGALDIDPPSALGLLFAIWDYADLYAPDGDVSGMVPRMTSSVMGSRINHERVWGALRLSGFVSDQPDGQVLVDNWLHTICTAPAKRAKSRRRWQRVKAAGGEIPPDVRRAVFDRDDHTCVLCKAQSDLTIDHKIPVSRLGTNDPENLQTLCRKCNSRKKDQMETSQ